MAKIKHEGLHADRLLPRADNPRERAFAAEWKKQAPGTLGHLIGDHTQRDAEVAATIIQWLGSNVGMSFIVTALNQEGYVVHPKRGLCQGHRAHPMTHQRSAEEE